MTCLKNDFVNTKQCIQPPRSTEYQYLAMYPTYSSLKQILDYSHLCINILLLSSYLATYSSTSSIQLSSRLYKFPEFIQPYLNQQTSSIYLSSHLCINRLLVSRYLAIYTSSDYLSIYPTHWHQQVPSTIMLGLILVRSRAA